MLYQKPLVDNILVLSSISSKNFKSKNQKAELLVAKESPYVRTTFWWEQFQDLNWN